MSCIEGLNGYGLVTKKVMKEFKKNLIAAHNNEIELYYPKDLKILSLKRATSWTREFPILIDRSYVIGMIKIDEDGSFQFELNECDNLLELAKDSKTYEVLNSFLNNISDRGRGQYGAVTYHWTEHDTNHLGQKCPGTYTFYGSWTKRNHGTIV